MPRGHNRFALQLGSAVALAAMAGAVTDAAAQPSRDVPRRAVEACVARMAADLQVGRGQVGVLERVAARDGSYHVGLQTPIGEFACRADRRGRVRDAPVSRASTGTDRSNMP